LSEIPFPEKNNTNKASAIVGFNSFGSLVWPKENSTGIKTPTLLIGGTYDLITPLINEQFRVFYALNNPSNRFLIIEGASHFSPIRIIKSYEDNNDVFKINETFIGSEPILVQDLSTKFIVEFLKNIKDKKIPAVVKNQRDLGLDFHFLDLETIKEVSKNIGFNNTEFLEGSIEKLDELDKDLNPLIKDKSVDIILSNCVLNLVSPESRSNLLRNIKRVLNDNGRIAISDIVSNKKVPLRLQNDHDLWTGCISGAWYEPDFISDFKELGFKNLEFAERSTEPWKVIDDIEFRTVTLVGNI